MLSKMCSSYVDKYTFITTWKDRSEFRILTPWHSTQEKDGMRRAGQAPGCHHSGILSPPTPET